MPADTHLFQVFFEGASPCLIGPPLLSSVGFWHTVGLHCCLCGSFSLQSEDVAGHFHSHCCNYILESLHACSPHHLFKIWSRHDITRVVCMVGRLHVGSGDGRHLTCEQSWPFSSKSHTHTLLWGSQWMCTDVTFKLMVVDVYRTKPLENGCIFSDPGAYVRL